MWCAILNWSSLAFLARFWLRLCLLCLVTPLCCHTHSNKPIDRICPHTPLGHNQFVRLFFCCFFLFFSLFLLVFSNNEENTGTCRGETTVKQCQLCVYLALLIYIFFFRTDSLSRRLRLIETDKESQHTKCYMLTQACIRNGYGKIK